MGQSHSESYKAAGVDITAGYESVKLMQNHVQRTITPGVLSGLGGFGGLFELDLSKTPNPVLVSGTDGVGTKLKLAFLLDIHNTIGIDCVAMCVNDIICSGAAPQFFLDYIACGKNIPKRIASIVEGIAEGCVQASCALIGGETAEMPGFYPEDEYDLAGFAVGVVDKSNILDNTKTKAGDVVIGLASSGVHSNGFSLVRKAFALEHQAEQYYPELGETLGQALLRPTRIYVKPVLSLIENLPVSGISHITGGGLIENIPRSLPKGLGVRLNQENLPRSPLFSLLQKAGEIPLRDMYNTFNMGVGMCVILPEQYAQQALSLLKQQGETAFVLGEVVQSEEGLIL